MSSRFPVLATALAGTAGSLFLATAVVPQLAPYCTPAVQPLALGLSGLWLFRRSLILERLLAERRRWFHSPPYPLAPTQLPPNPPGLFLGQGFQWDAEPTQALETALIEDKRLPVARDSRGGIPALHAVGRKQEQPLSIPWSELGGHVGITGTTGSGKTVLLKLLATGAIHARGALVFIDPKGERELLARCAAEARRAHKRLVMILPAFPEHSARMNVLGTTTTTPEIAARIRALMPNDTEKPFFSEYPLALIERLAQVQASLQRAWTIEGLYPPSVFRHHLAQLLDDYLAHKGFRPTSGKGDPQKRRIDLYQDKGPSDLLADALIDDLEKPRDHFMKVTSNLIPAFRGVVGDPLGPLFSAIDPDVTWQQIVDEEMVVYVSLASMLLGDIANRVGRVILQDLIGFIGRQYAYTDTTNAMPLTVIVDELRQVLYPNFMTALEMARGAGVRFILAQQSLAAGEFAVGLAAAKLMAANLNTKIWCRIADDDDSATVATQGIDTCTVHLPETGIGLSYGGVGGLSGSSHRRLVAKEVPLIRPAWLTGLPRGEAFVRMRGEVWKLRIPYLEPVAERDFDPVLRTIWASMDPSLAPPPETFGLTEAYEELALCEEPITPTRMETP